jgi:hypothetical protein
MESIGESTIMTNIRPAEALVAGLPAPMPDGLNGEVSCVRACLVRQGVDEGTADLYGVSGAAFRAYFYRRALQEDRPADDADWCWSSEVFSSRDALGAIARYCGAAIERHQDLPPDAAWALVEQEISQGRAVISYGIGGPFEPVIITGYRRGARRVLRVQSKFLAARDAEVDVTGKENWAGESAPLRNPIVTVRAGDVPRPDIARRTALRIEACRWALEHGRRGRERLVNGKVYAAGTEAFEAFADFLVSPASGLAAALGREGEAEEVALFVAVLSTEWRRARQAAALFLEGWAFEGDEAGRLAPRPAGGIAALRRAAARYRAVAEALEGFGAALPAPWDRAGEGEAIAALEDPMRRGRAADVLRAAGALEAAALAALETVLEGEAVAASRTG